MTITYYPLWRLDHCCHFVSFVLNILNKMLNLFDPPLLSTSSYYRLFPPPRINLYYKFSVFSFQSHFHTFQNFSEGRKLHSLYCFLSGVLWITLLGKRQRSAWPFVLWSSPTLCGLWYGCQGASSDGAVALVELKWLSLLWQAQSFFLSSCCSTPRTTRIMAWYFVSWAAGQLDRMPPSVSAFASKITEASPKIKQFF